MDTNEQTHLLQEDEGQQRHVFVTVEITDRCGQKFSPNITGRSALVVALW